MPDEVVSIDALLAGLGHTSPESRHLARAIIEAAGLTNPRKRNIAIEKRDEVARVLDERLVRTCGDARCEAATAHDPRPRALVDRPACQVCHGSANGAAVASMARALKRAGRISLLVVGGSPNAHAELQRLLEGSEVALQLVEGTTAIAAKRADSWAESADVIVIWGSTQLAHKVSNQFGAPRYAAKRITVARRGIAALADAVVEHVGAAAGR
ncbi:MAG: hypothetical protein GEU80_03990 [Dehalococcoidia bacterium]|nr:hypothetical protein [Dehalococcoidia bacterium]